MESKHLKVLGFGCPERLGDAEFVTQFLKDAVERVGMRPLGEPMVHDVALDVEKLGQELFEDEGGVTCQIVGYHTLSTSHLAIHTWPLRKEFHFDLYSCRLFDAEDLIQFISERFHVTQIQVSDLTSHCEWQSSTN